MGLTLSDAARILLTRVAREKMMPLELMTPSAETLAAMEDARTGNKLPRVHFKRAPALPGKTHEAASFYAHREYISRRSRLYCV